jgi:hypothetical protein
MTTCHFKNPFSLKVELVDAWTMLPADSTDFEIAASPDVGVIYTSAY